MLNELILIKRDVQFLGSAVVGFSKTGSTLSGGKTCNMCWIRYGRQRKISACALDSRPEPSAVVPHAGICAGSAG